MIEENVAVRVNDLQRHKTVEKWLYSKARGERATGAYVGT